MYSALIFFALLSAPKCAAKSQEELTIVADAISEASEIFEVTPLLLAAVVVNESACDVNAVSMHGLDIGLGQVRLKTARTMWPGISSKDLKDPQVNVFIMTNYLALQIEKCHSIKRALGAYSSGHCKVNNYARKVFNTYRLFKRQHTTWINNNK
jgi:soluble lytic murein transglycosylase-like protein